MTSSPIPHLFDSHAHFSVDTAEEVLSHSIAAGMDGLVAVGADDRANTGAMAAARAYLSMAPKNFQMKLALGFDFGADKTPEEAVAALTQLRAEAPLPLSAVGELGLDAHYGTPATLPLQRARFERLVALASEWNLPVIVHCRETEADILAILKSAGSKSLSAEGRLGVLHCFVGDAAFAREVLDLGMMVSLSGIVTFRNAETLREVAKLIPRDRLLVETDSPYLAPVPLRGKVCEPAFVEHTVRRLAEVRGEDPAELAAAMRENARRLFGE